MPVNLVVAVVIVQKRGKQKKFITLIPNSIKNLTTTIDVQLLKTLHSPIFNVPNNPYVPIIAKIRSILKKNLFKIYIKFKSINKHDILR